MPVAPRLSDPVVLAGHEAPSRVLFGPHETNLGRDRGLSDRHLAYYAARAQGGTGVLVTETASVHPSDWPYERAPLAAECGPGWQALAERCRPHGTVVLAGLGHAGAQGSSAHSQSTLWAPSPVADVVNREMPQVMEEPELRALVDGFAAAARLAVASGLAGVEIDVGPYSLLRQFHSGLTNQRGDAYGEDRLLLTTEVLDAVRSAIGDDHVLALRLCADELAPWAGVTPEQAVAQVDRWADRLDLLTVVRGGPYSTSAYRPTAHMAPLFNRELCAALHGTAAGRTAVVLQGSVVDVAAAQAALDDGTCELVEMTRAQIADPELVTHLRAGRPERIRPCVLCNQACHVRDNRNPIVSCIGEPRSGHETTEPAVAPGASGPASVVVGGGVAGLECARVLALGGRSVRLVEADSTLGGSLAVAAVGPGQARLAQLVEWLITECEAEGVEVELDHAVSAEELDALEASGLEVVLATGSVPSPVAFAVEGPAEVRDARSVLEAGVGSLPDGPVVIDDPVGGPVGVALAEWLAGAGRSVSLITQDQIAGTLLSRSGDLADANTRLQQVGVTRELRAILRGIELGDGSAEAVLEDVWTGERRRIPAAVVIDASHRLPADELPLARPHLPRAGDCVAPRSALEAVLEGRRTAQQLLGRTTSTSGAGARPHPTGATT